MPFVLWLLAGAVLLISFDQFALFRTINGHYSPFLNELMFHATKMGQAEVIIPVLAGLMLLKKYRNWWYFTLATASNVIPMLLQQSLKSIFDKPRPMHYFEHTTWLHILENWDRVFERSFPSGHTQGAFSFFCFLSILLPQRYRMVGAVLFLLALLVGYSRVYLAAHFVADVYAGSIIGALGTPIVFVLMSKYVRRYFPITS